MGGWVILTKRTRISPTSSYRVQSLIAELGPKEAAKTLHVRPKQLQSWAKGTGYVAGNDDRTILSRYRSTINTKNISLLREALHRYDYGGTSRIMRSRAKTRIEQERIIGEYQSGRAFLSPTQLQKLEQAVKNDENAFRAEARRRYIHMMETGLDMEGQTIDPRFYRTPTDFEDLLNRFTKALNAYIETGDRRELGWAVFYWKKMGFGRYVFRWFGY